MEMLVDRVSRLGFLIMLSIQAMSHRFFNKRNTFFSVHDCRKMRHVLRVFGCNQGRVCCELCGRAKQKHQHINSCVIIHATATTQAATNKIIRRTNQERKKSEQQQKKNRVLIWTWHELSVTLKRRDVSINIRAFEFNLQDIDVPKSIIQI